MTAIVKKFLSVLLALVLVVFLAIVVMPQAMPVKAQGDTWYVNAITGNDAYNGTAPNDAFQTIGHAVATANATDTISVAAGTYTERFDVNKPLTLTGNVNQPSNVVVNAPDTNKNVITLTADGCVLRGFKVQDGKFGINLESNNNTLTGNHITGNSIGVKIQETVDASTISINFNNIYGNTIGGVDNDSISNANAENNWWGANSGPSPSPGSNVDYDPWIVLGVSANPTSIVADDSSTSTITADMTRNSADQDTSTLGHIPDGTQIVFTTDKGSIGSLQVTKETSNGKATAILTSSTTVETATVTAEAPPTTVAQDSTTVDFTLAPLDHFTFANISSPQTAAATFSITITAKDQSENTINSYTGTNTLSDTTTTITPTSTGSFTNGVWTGNVAITKAQTGVTITTTGEGKSGTSNSFDVNAGSLDHIVISPDTANATAGDTQAYTAEAFDQYNNSLGSVTGDTTFEIAAGAGGSWTANVYTSENTGTWTVTGTYSAKSDTATLTVTASSLDHIVISPDTANATAGDTQTYTAEAFDQYNTSLGDVTSDTAFEIPAGAGGSWTANVYTSENTGTWTVTGTSSSKSDTATLTVTASSLDHIVISPNTANATAGDTQAYTAEAFDQYDISLGDVTSDTAFEIPAGAGGSWTANVYTSENTGTWTVTGTYSGKSDTATLTVTAGSLHHIVTSPDTANVTAGDTQTYTAEAFDLYDNSLGSVTGNTTFEIPAGAGGSWTANVYTSENTGTWTVTGTYSAKSDTATLTVTAKSLHHIVILPDTANITAGNPQAYTAEAFDQYNTSLGYVTSGTAFEIAAGAGGSWTANVYTSENAGTWTVTGAYGGKSDTATLTVKAGYVPPTVFISSPQDGYSATDRTVTIVGTAVATPAISEATLTVNGVPRTITVTDGKFSTAVNLVNGDNTIVVSTTNAAGAATTPTITVTLNKGTAPTPSSGSTTNWWLIISNLNWWLTGGILGGVVLIAIVIFTVFPRRY